MWREGFEKAMNQILIYCPPKFSWEIRCGSLRKGYSCSISRSKKNSRKDLVGNFQNFALVTTCLLASRPGGFEQKLALAI
jgi:hypothetical protein